MDNFFSDIAVSLYQVAAIFFRAFSPLFIGLILAYLLNPLTEWVRQRIAGKDSAELHLESPKGRIPAIIITYVAVSALIFFIIYAFIILILGALPSGGIYETAQKVYEYFSTSYDNMMSFLSKYLPEDLTESSYNPKNELMGWLGKNLSFSNILETIGAFAGSLINIFVGIVASIYLLKDKEFFISLWQQFMSVILKQRTHGVISEILNEINQVITTFIKGALVDSIIVALLSSIALSVLKVKYAVIIGLIGGILNIIPYFGPFFGMVPAFFAALATGGLGQAIMAVLALFGVQQIDSNYIYPKIVGTSIGLHPFFVLLSVSVFGYFGGIAGMLLAVPLAGIAQVLIKRWAYKS